MTRFRPDRLREFREFRGLSQNELALKSGTDAARINRYEKAGEEPTSRILGQMADALGITIDFLLGRDNFDGQPIAGLAARESFELFVRQTIVAATDLERLRKMISNERAPTTADGWIAIHELTRKRQKAGERRTAPHVSSHTARPRELHHLKAVPKKRR